MIPGAAPERRLHRDLGEVGSGERSDNQQADVAGSPNSSDATGPLADGPPIACRRTVSAQHQYALRVSGGERRDVGFWPNGVTGDSPLDGAEAVVSDQFRLICVCRRDAWRHHALPTIDRVGNPHIEIE